MGFYRLDPEMSADLEKLLKKFSREGRPGLENSISISWIRYESRNPQPGSGFGTGWLAHKPCYPASVVKLIYAVAIEAWLQKDLITNSPELQRALKDMIQDSSNDATSLILDLLSGTTSGPSLIGERWEGWKKQRQLVNEWLTSFNWEELKGFNCCQKTWSDSPYGRERDFYGVGNINRNSLTTAGTARILESIMTNSIVSEQACQRLKKILSRSLDEIERQSNPENQIDGFLGEGCPKGSQIWSKAGWMSQARHDAIWCNKPESKPMLLVVFTQGQRRSKDKTFLPALANELHKLHSQRS